MKTVARKTVRSSVRFIVTLSGLALLVSAIPNEAQTLQLRDPIAAGATQDRGGNCLDQAVRTANPNATAEAKRVLAYLKRLAGKPDQRIVSGQFIGGGERSSFKEIEEVQKKTRTWVGMVGNDYAQMHDTDIKGD